MHVCGPSSIRDKGAHGESSTWSEPGTESRYTRTVRCTSEQPKP